MPIVRSYYRRSAGAAAAQASAPSRLDVAIYNAAGTELLREPAGARYGAGNLAFDTAAPGGFGTAAFTLPRRVARHWPGRTGLKVIVRRGNTICWWGWVEDITQRLHPDVDDMTVACMGPYQVLTQRLFSPAYTGTLYGEAALAAELTTYCPELSPNVSELTATGVNIAPLTWTNKPISDLVRLVCQSGNSAGLPMLFAIWEPNERSMTGYPVALNSNANFETLIAGMSYPAGWNLTLTAGNANWLTSTTIYNSPVRGVRVFRGTGTGTQTGHVGTATNFAVTAGTTYVVDYYAYFGAVTSMNVYARVNWYTAAGALISQVALTTRNSTGSAFGARYVESLVAPATAANGTLQLRFSLPDSGSNAYVGFDDAYIYAAGAATEIDRRPRARLWAQDLSGYDYLLVTGELDEALTAVRTSRELANYVLASYGSSYTSANQDTPSQALYRKRDRVVSAGSVSGTVAAAMRDVALTRYRDPVDEPSGFRLSRPGPVRTAHGAPVWPEDIRAGDRLRIADGPLAGMIFSLARTAYANGVMTLTPAGLPDTPLLLAQKAV